MRALALAVLLSSSAAPAYADDTPSGGPEVLFTFDDGPARGKTEKVLDLLDQHHIKAVFFVNGWHFQGTQAAAEEERALLRETLRRGHAVGNHTVHHYFLCGKVYSKRATQEIEENAALIEAATGVRPILFRTPYGAHCKPLSVTLKSLGIDPIGWDIDPQDWRLRDAAKITQYVTSHLKTLHGRAILLLHDVQAATVQALPKILDWLERENAARAAHGRTPIKVMHYAYLLPSHPVIPPYLDALGRMLILAAEPVLASPVAFWPVFPDKQGRGRFHFRLVASGRRVHSR